jgi:mevalonate kinase
VDRRQVLELAREVDRCRAAQDYDGVRRVAKSDYFAPQQYVLASLFEGGSWPQESGLTLEWESEVPSSSGLGSGGSAFVAMVAAVAALAPAPISVDRRIHLAHRGDVVAHGGIASSLDTQTSLHGGVIRFSADRTLAEPLPCAPGLQLVVGHTGVAAATGEVNAGVRRWLAGRPKARMAYFEAVGALSRAAGPALWDGDWKQLGRLFNLNQLVLEKIGVSTPDTDRLIYAALDAGAYGAKISGSGGGGIVIALVSPETKQAVADAIAAAGGTALAPAVGVRGAHVTSHEGT